MIGSTRGTIGNIVGSGSLGGGSKVSGFGSLGGSSFSSINWPKANSVAMTHYTTSLIENAFIGSFFGTISGNTTQEITANVGWGTIAGAYLVCAGIASIPMPGARALAGGCRLCNIIN